MLHSTPHARRLVVGCLALTTVLLCPAVAVEATELPVDPEPTWGTAPGGGKAQVVLALAEAGGRVYLGGDFTRMVSPSGSTQSRSRLAAIDVATGALTSWKPGADGAVRAMVLSPDRTHLYIAGDFTHAGGQSVPKVAALDLATGKADPRFHAGVEGRVRGLALSGGRLYVGGDFTSVSGSPRPKVAALDAGTGALLDWTPPGLGPGRYIGHTGRPTPGAEAGDVYDVAASGDGSRVYVAGNFLDFAGRSALLALDAGTAQPLPKQWAIDRPVFALDVWQRDGSTVFAATGGPGGRLYALRPQSTRPVWKAAVDGDAVGVAASNATVYLMGHYDFVGGKGSSCSRSCPDGSTRRHLAAFDAATGTLSRWNPTADTNTGPEAVTVGTTHLFVGGEFKRINGRAQPGYAQFPGVP